MLNNIQVTPASPWKRLFAWVYDWLPAAGIFVLVFVVGMALANVIFYNLSADELSIRLRNNPIWILYLFAGTSVYYLYCWLKAGQTVGLKTWRIKLVKADGRLLNGKESIIRVILSCGGLANLWAFMDKDYRGWHDIAVDAYLVQMPKMKKTEEEKKPLI